MKYFTILRTTQILNIALGENGQCLGETKVYLRPGLLPDLELILENLLHPLGFQFTDLDFVGIVKDPANEQSCETNYLHKELRIPHINVSVLDMLAWAALDCEKGVAVIQSEGHSLWYKACYVWDRNQQIPICVEAPHKVTTQELLKELAEENRPILVNGEPVFRSECKKLITMNLRDTVTVLPDFYDLHHGFYSVQVVWNQWLKLGPDEIILSLYESQEMHREREISADGPLKIRIMREEDLKDVMKIEIESFISPWTPLAFVSELRHNEDAHYFCLYSSNKLMSYLGIWFISDDGYITKLAVSPEFRGQGMGTYIVQHVLEWMRHRGMKRLNLEVHLSNKNAIKFYERIGFFRKEIKKEYYTDPPEDAIVMTMALKDS